MSVNRTRRKRTNANAITPELVEAFRKWNELDSRCGAGNTPEGYLLTDDEWAEYRELSNQIESALRLKPWESGPCYSMYGRKTHPRPGDWNYEKRSIEFRKRLEKAANE